MDAMERIRSTAKRRGVACFALSLLLAWVAGACNAHAQAQAQTQATLRVGGDADYAPYHFIDARGEADGFDVALAREVAADLGMEAKFELGDWSTTLDRLSRGELDVVPMFWSAARERRFLITEPLLLRHHALFGHYETPAIAELGQLAGVRIAVQRSGLAWEALRELEARGVAIVELDNEAEALHLVAAGGADYALVPTGIGYHAIQRAGLRGIVALSPPLLERRYVFAVARGRPELVPAINASLERLRRDGVQNRLYVEWIGHPGGRPAVREAGGDWPARAAAAALVSLLVVAGLAWLRRRRSEARRAPGPVEAHAGRSAPAIATGATPRLLDELREAIAGDRLGFALQPKIDLRSGRWRGAELLVRWHHPLLGPLPPDAFVPAAEQARMIDEMTLHLVRRGLAQARDWPDTGDPLQLSVNVSANDLADPDLVDAIIEASREGGPGLVLEVTETAVMREPERVSAALPRLRSHGIGISVDDFGAGHSSLVNLRRLAPEELKIDRSFVRALLSSRSDRAIVRATIQLGHELHALIAAEGIEDEATRRWLAEAGCDLGQGFGIARPMPPDEFVALLGRGAPAAPTPLPATP